MQKNTLNCSLLSATMEPIITYHIQQEPIGQPSAKTAPLSPLVATYFSFRPHHEPLLDAMIKTNKLVARRIYKISTI